MSCRHLYLFIMMLALFTAPAQGSEPLPDGEPVDIAADEFLYEKENDTLSALGHVRLQKGDLTLLSDRVLWHSATGDAEASGAVQLIGPQAVVEGEDLSINLETGFARLTDARIRLRETNYRIAGEEIERLGEDRYVVTGGVFTACDGEPPAWKFTATRLDVTVNGYAKARNVLFYLRDLPVLYLPYMAYPVKTERESGFLLPRIGSSSRRGFEFSLAWYQVIDRHLDATFSLDYLSSLGIGKGIEYRYTFGEQGEGVARAYHLSGLQGEEDRYALDWQHAGRLPGKVRLTADVEYVSSRDYYEDFGLEAGEYNKEEVQSVVALSRHWRLTSLTGQLKYIKDLEKNNDLTLQKLPEIGLSSLSHRLGESPFFLSFDSTYSNLWRQEGVTGQRVALRPELSAVFHPRDFLEIRPAIGYLERLYWTSGEGSAFEREGLVDFSTRISSRFGRIYRLDGKKLKKVRHSIEPEIAYRFVPQADQEHLPQFDTLDRIPEENSLSYGLVNRLVGRLENVDGVPEYHEYLYLRLSQSYEIGDAREEIPGARDPFSPLRTELIVRPNRWTFLDLDARYDVNAGGGDFSDRLTDFTARAGARDDGGNGLSLDYQYHREELNYLGGSVDIAWLRPVYLNYLHRQDLDGGRILEQALNLEYRAQCWSLFLTVRDRLDATEYTVSFSLAGLGKIAGLGGSLGGAGN